MMEAYTPAQTMQLIVRMGEKKAKTRLDKFFTNSFLAGPLLGFGCALSLSTATAPWYQENAPGLIRTISACFFPIGLILVVLTGAELFTSTVMFLPVACLERRITILDLGRGLGVAFFGNLLGMLFFMAVICGYGGIFDDEEMKKQAAKNAVKKAVEVEWWQIFIKAIAANWLVCLAVFFANSSREIGSKIMAMWWPIMTFVALGMDHVVANFFLIPIGIWCGAPIGVWYYIYKSMLPSLVGNAIGGGVFVGVMYWYIHMTGKEAVAADFDKPEQNCDVPLVKVQRPSVYDSYASSIDGFKHSARSSVEVARTPWPAV
ncbi:Putative formate/nitrite transporter, aquaporin [Septoria linicola]|uniref:Formate/nitrite transporter, aquaporin n=1 Tax=Septoria linicola TaxID=215465 RepID=A0A9Q9AN39_9PEZI|nr:putative formate/nitrite transporter, aquaporin [Septoria linicola]USW49047.1 Putative formate/nitrite transporter, aquaporin [Septoria linicola]